MPIVDIRDRKDQDMDKIRRNYYRRGQRTERLSEEKMSPPKRKNARELSTRIPQDAGRYWKCWMVVMVLVVDWWWW